jgi:hypothetical protein
MGLKLGNGNYGFGDLKSPVWIKGMGVLIRLGEGE